jgi:hypothetical protein
MANKNMGRFFISCFFALGLCIVASEPLFAFKAGAHAVLSKEVAYCLPEQSTIRNAILQYPEIAAWGATGPDLPANEMGILIDDAPWFEAYHYEKVGSFASELLRLALQSNDLRNIAWAAGWVTHVTGDLYCHGVFVNPDPEVDGVYLANPDTKEMHGLLEAWADKLLFSDKSNPKRSYTAQNMQATFRSFESSGVRNLMVEATRNVFGKSPLPEEYENWMDFFKGFYLDTGVAGGTNWVYDNTYGEVSQYLQEGVLAYGPFAGMTRADRLEYAYQQAMDMAAGLLFDVERNMYRGFSDAWNLDAYHLDHRSIGTLTVTIRTADTNLAGTDDDVRFGLVRDDGEQWLSPVLDKGSGLFGIGSAICNDFERGSNETYYLFIDRGDFPPGRISQVFLEKSEDRPWGEWKPESLTVTINGIPYFDGMVNTWLQDDHLRWSGEVLPVAVQYIPVNLSLHADAVRDIVEIEAINLVTKRPYTGTATIHLQHRDGSVLNHAITIGIDGTYRSSLQLKPDDLVQVNIYRPLPNDSHSIYIGGTSLRNPTVSHASISFNCDAFNDLISGTIGGSYTGPVFIGLSNDEDPSRDVDYVVQANRGIFAKTVHLIGSDRVSVKIQYEGVDLPFGPRTKTPNLDALVLASETTGRSSLQGTITNTAEGGTHPYTGDVMLSSLYAQTPAALTQATAYGFELRQPVKAARKSQGETRTSSFGFIDVPIVLSLGYEIQIEHNGIVKYLSFDPLEEMEERAERPVQQGFASVVQSVTDKIVNPAERTGLAHTDQMQTVTGQMGASFVQMLPPSPPQDEETWNGVWETNLGSLLLEQSGDTVQGILGDEGYRLHGKISQDNLKGIIEIDGVFGEFACTLYAQGLAFDGRLRLEGEDTYDQWDGSLVAYLDHSSDSTAFGGVWFSDLGGLVLSATASGYTGVYGEDRNTLEGVLSNGVLRGELQEKWQSGEFRFKLCSDSSFEGQYKYYGEDDWQSWDGRKTKIR